MAAGRGRAQAAVEPRSVFIEPGGDARLTTALANALAARDVKVIATAARARLSIGARIEISVRPSPVGGTSALTADFVATLQIRDAAGGARSTKSIDGHALDFGEPVVRQAAYNRAAEQLAEFIDAAMRD